MEPSRPRSPFRVLYEEHFRLVCSLVRRLGVREADAPDVAQEVFGVLARRMDEGLDTSGSLLPYLKRIAVTRALNWKATARNREQPHADEDAVEAMTDARACEDPMRTSISLRECVDAVLERLPRDQRVVLVLADLEEMPSDEVADLLGVSVAAMYSRLYRAREAFGRVWSQQRASGLAVFAPFALWDAGSLLANDRAIPPASPGLQEEVWRRLVASGAASAAGAGAAGGGAAAAGAVAAKAGIMMTAKQLLVGAVLAGLAGAGIYAALTTEDEQTRAKTATMSVRHEELDRAGSAAIATAPGSAVPMPSATAAEGSASAVLVESAAPIASAAVNTEANERRLLDSARDAITRRDWAGAHTALARVRSARNAAERDYLLGIVRSYEQDGGAR